MLLFVFKASDATQNLGALYVLKKQLLSIPAITFMEYTGGSLETFLVGLKLMTFIDCLSF